MTSEKPHLVPIEIVEEFEKGTKFQDLQDNQVNANFLEKNEIEQLSITNGSLVVKNGVGREVMISDNLINKDQDLQKIKNYLINNNKTSLNRQELNAVLLNSSLVPTSNSNNNNRLELGLVIGGTLTIGLFIRSLIKKGIVKKLK